MHTTDTARAACPTQRIILAELPCTTYSRNAADRVAYLLRRDHILPRHEIVCSAVVKANGERVYRVFVKSVPTKRRDYMARLS